MDRWDIQLQGEFYRLIFWSKGEGEKQCQSEGKILIRRSVQKIQLVLDFEFLTRWGLGLGL